MKFGLSVPQFETFADVKRLADLANEAEGADGMVSSSGTISCLMICGDR